jgi:hypothetical protein
MARTKYSDHQRAEALAALQANGRNFTETAKQLRIPANTIRDWARDPPPYLTELRDEKRDALAERLRDIAHRLVDAMPGKIPEAPLNHVAVSLGITVDKLQLLEGKPTEIAKHEHQRTEVTDRAAEAAAVALRRRGLVN